MRKQRKSDIFAKTPLSLQAHICVSIESTFLCATVDVKTGTHGDNVERNFLRIGAQLNTCSENKWKFKQLYVEAVQIGGANHEAVLGGLFLGKRFIDDCAIALLCIHIEILSSQL